MNDARESDVREVAEVAPEAAKGAVTYTIKVLSTERAEGRGGLRTVLFRRVSAGESIEISAETDAENLLAKLPDFLDAALEMQRALWPAQRTVSRLSSSFFPRFAEESRLIRWLTERAGEDPLRGELARRRAAREAMIVRDVAWEALRKVLLPERRHEIDALVGFHEAPAALEKSMEAVAALIERMLADPGDAQALAVTDIDAAYAAALRRQAAALRASESEGAHGERREKRPKRGLLRLIGMAYRALGTGAFMTLPRVDPSPWEEETRVERGKAQMVSNMD
jgi:hypothetical protein